MGSGSSEAEDKIKTFLDWLIAKYGVEEGKRRFREWVKISSVPK